MSRARALPVLAVGFAALWSCANPGTRPYRILRAEPTAAFPVAWHGQGAAPAAALAAGTRSAQPPGRQAAAPQHPAGVLRISPQQLVAVLELRSKLKGKDAEGVDAVYFGNQVRADIKSSAPQSQVMTRENVLVMLQASGRKAEDCEGECEVDTGRRLGADLVVSGELVRIGSRLKLDLRLHDTRNGQLLSGVTAQGKSIDDLDDDLARAVKTLISW